MAYGDLPGFGDILQTAVNNQGPQQAAPNIPQPSGDGNPVIAALGSGLHGTIGSFGSFGETLARAVGADSVADAAKGFADRERATAASYARPDYEGGSILDPRVLGYKALQMLPGMVPMFAGGAGGAAVKALGYAPKIAEAVGAGLGAFPGVVGGNTQTNEDYAGALDQGSALKSLAYGVPEAALQAILPAKIEKGLAGGVAQKVAKDGTTVAQSLGEKALAGFKSGVATQIPVTAATDFLTQQMGDPNRSFADRAKDIVSDALTGGLVGGVLGAATHPFMAVRDLSKKPASEISTSELEAAGIDAMRPPAPTPPIVPPIMASARARIAAERQAAAQAASPTGEVPLPTQFGGVQPEAPPFGRRQAQGVVPEGSGDQPLPEPNADVQPQPLPEPPPADQGQAYDWPARRKELQQAGVWTPILKGREFQSEDELKQAVFDNINQRVQDDMNVPAKLSALGDHLGITKEGALTDQFKATSEGTEPEKAAMPADEAPLAGPQPGRERLEKTEIDGEANQGRWQRLEDLATKLSTDDVSNPAVKGLMDQVTAAQNSIPDLKGKGVMKKFDSNISKLEAQASARDQVTEAAPPAADTTAPATTDKPSPAVSDFIAKMSQKSDTAPLAATPIEGETPATPPPTKEAALKAKRRAGKGAVSPPEKPPETEAQTEPVIDQSPKEKIAAEVNAAEPALAPKPAEIEAAAKQAIPREQGIGNDARLYEQLQASQPADAEAALQMKEATRSAPAAEPAVAEPAPTKEATAKAKRTKPTTPAPELVSADQQNRGLEPDRQTIEQAKRAKQMSDVVGKLKMIETSKRPVAPVPQGVLANIDAAKTHLMTMMNAKLKGTFGTMPGEVQRYQDLLDDHDSRLSVYERAAKIGGMEALREIPQDFFGSDLWDEMGGKVDRATQAVMEKHANAEQNLADMSTRSRERPLVAYDSPPTQHDMDLQNVVSNARDVNDPLTYLRQNGSNIFVKSMANTLLKLGLKDTIRMAEPEEFAQDTSRKLNQGEVIAGSHNDDLKRISIYNGSHMEQTILHEAIHAATIRAIKGSGEAGKAIQELYERIKANSPDNNAYGLHDAAELVAEAGSNPAFQQFLRSERVSTGSFVGDAWQALKNVIFKALGMPDRTRGLFDQVMDTTQRLMGENVREAAVAGETPKILNRGVKLLNDLDQQRAAEGVRQLDKVLEGAAIGTRSRIVHAAIGWVPTDQLAERMGRWIGPAVKYADLQNLRGVRADTLAKPELVAHNAMMHLPEKMQEALNRLAAVDGFDPRKPWSQQPKEVLTHSQADILKENHAQAVHDLDVLRGDKTGHAVAAYEQAITAGRFKQKLKEAYHFHDAWVRNGYEGAEGFANDPMREYDGAYKLHDSPAASFDWINKRVNDMRTSAEQQALAHDTRIKQIDAELAKTPKPDNDTVKDLNAEKKSLNGQRGELRGMITSSMQADKDAAISPYFHHGRDGDHFVASHITRNEDTKLPDDNHVQALRDMMAKNGFEDANISRGVNNDTVYVRLNSEIERERLYELFQGMEKGKDAPLQAGSSSRGMAHEANIYSRVGPSWMREAIEQVQASRPDIPAGMSDADAKRLVASHKQQVAELTRSMMDMIPDTATTKIYAPRKNVQGFNSDMIENFKKQSISNSRGLSNLSLAREIGEARKATSDRLKELNADPTVKGDRLTTLTQMTSELLSRGRDFTAHTPSGVLDMVKKLTHTVSVGMSPSYVLMLLSQIPTLSLPELGKTHGYVAASQAMARNTSLAFKVMNAVRQGDAALTFGLRYSDLVKAGINERDANFIMNLASRGVFNHGAYTDAMTGHEGGGKLSTTMHAANSMSRYAEQFPRILTALAARDLHEAAPQKAGGKDVYQFARDATMNSQFNWNQALNARQTTRQGNFGTMSPLINQFMGYTTRMTAKLYKEAHDGFLDKELRGTPEGAEQSKQARKWMYGHLAAMTTLAGTMGLPMASVLASVYDQLADWATGKDDHDVNASYRTFLSNTFGKEVGEVIARGAPRALGIDTDHFGEGSIVPGSRSIEALTEKRKWEDAQKDWLKNMAGSSVGELFNAYASMRDFHNGDYLDGSIKLLPEALKKGAEAIKLGKYGFIDKNGAKLPIDATATDVLMTAMGLDPAKEAEYDEANKTASGLKNMRLIRSSNIERHLQLAANRGDRSMEDYWMKQAAEYQADHPGLRGPAQTFSRQLMLHERSAQIARQTGLPIGVQPRDQAGAGMVSFANLRNGS